MCRCKHSRNLIDNGRRRGISVDRRFACYAAALASISFSMGRNYLKGPEGVRINTILAAAGYNFGLLLHWLAGLLRAFIVALT